MEPDWLKWAKRIQAIAQTGLAYVKDPYDRERYDELRELSVEIISTYTNEQDEKIRDLFAGDSGYATPKVDVRGVIFKDDKILLVKELMDGKWTLPGGWADIGISAAESVIKEVKEESGYDVEPVKLLGILDRNKQNHPAAPYDIYKIFFLCEITGGKSAHSIETGGVGFYPENDLPELSVSRTTHEQIRWLFDHRRNPDRPADFE